MVRYGLAVGVGVVLAGWVGLLLVASAQQPRVVPSGGGRMADPREWLSFEAALLAETVVVGQVAAVEKELVEAEDVRPRTPTTAALTVGGRPAAPDNKTKYTVASVKIEDGLLMSKNVTHLKVGFAKGGGPELAVGEKYLLHLRKHPTEGFEVVAAGVAPVSAKDDKFKAAVAEVTKLSAVLKEPTTALKADKAADRSFAAAVLLTKYRTPPAGARNLTFEEVDADESALLLKAIADGDWAGGGPLNAFGALRMLGLTDKDGWVSPKATGNAAAEEYRKAYTAWLADKGKGYRIKKLVAKK
jgi:hypothetical protein